MISRSRLAASAALLVLVLSAPLDAATVVRERLRDDVELSWYSAIAVGSDGVVHRAWREGDGKDPSSTLAYARGEMGEWITEAVDDREPVLGSDNIAVDADGRVHLSYYWNNREQPSRPRFSVVHAVREAEGWVRTTLASPDVVSSTTLAVGPDGLPRVGWLAFYDEVEGDGPAVIASFDGSDWITEELPVDGTPVDLQVDPQGASHTLVFGNGNAIRYFTDASGSWSEEELPEVLEYARLAMDGDGVAHVAGYLVDGSGSQKLRHLVRGTSGWEVDASLEDAGGRYRRERPFLLAGPEGSLHVLFAEQRQEVWDGDSDRWIYSFDGTAWTRQSFATREDSAEINAAAVGPDGLVHVICAGREAPWVDYIRIGGPEVEMDASGLRVIRRKDGVAVRGRLRIRNLDSRRSEERTLRFARAERDEFRPGDEPLGRERRVRPLRAGGRRSIRISLSIPDPSPGERLLYLLERAGEPGSGSAGAVRLVD